MSIILVNYDVSILFVWLRMLLISTKLISLNCYNFPNNSWIFMKLGMCMHEAVLYVGAKFSTLRMNLRGVF